MEIVIATPAMGGPGGVQSYVLTLAPQLLRLGHGVTVLTDELGAAARIAEEHGIAVTDDERALPRDADATLSQDAPMAYRMAARYPRATRWIVVHSAEYDLHLPPALADVVSAAVVMNGPVARRVAACARPPRLVRLRQPIDHTRLAAVGELRPERPRVLFLGNYLRDGLLAAFGAACDDAGSPWSHAGLHGTMVDDPGAAIAAADVVVGMGRSVLDGMSCGRAAWVSGPSAGDGWVTAESYPAMEDDGFRGRVSAAAPDPAALARGLAGYAPAMGATNRCLVATHHTAYDHANAIATGLGEDAPGRPVPGPLDELAHLVRTQHDHQARVAALRGDLDAMRHAWCTEEAARETAVAALADARALLAERDRALAALLATRRWRVMRAAARPLDAVRARAQRA